MANDTPKRTTSLPLSRFRRSGRVLRPLYWWLLLVLVLFGIRSHERLMEKTRLSFKVTLEGRPVEFEAVARLDGYPISNGRGISLGPHVFKLGHAKAEAFSTNLFTFYGGHDLGTIDLKRATGTLQVSLNRPAKNLTVRGPEWKLDLKDTSGGTWVVPTDRYEVEAQFAYSSERDSVVVSANAASTVRIAPGVGTVHVISSHSSTSFRLSGKNNYVNVDGELPVMINDLPTGEYELGAERFGERKVQTVSISAERTNEILVKFSYGLLTLETDPEGATAIDNNGRERGRSPLTLPELPEGAWRFRVEREGYEPLTAAVWIYSNQSNYFQTNLVSHQFAAAVRLARDYLAAGQYEEAARSADEALQHKAGNTVATSLKREAMGRSHLARAKAYAERADYGSALEELKSASEFFPENAQIKDLVASYVEKQKDVLEREAQKKAKERAEEQRQARINGLKMSLAIECRRYSGFEAFAVHELSTTNDVREVAKVLPRAMTVEAPIFEMARYEWQHGDFVMDYRQKVFDGSRQCVIVGGQVSTNECVICFRVIEGQTPHGFSWAGGLITAQLTTEGDRNGERAARLQQQIQEGAKMVEERIQRALGAKH